MAKERMKKNIVQDVVPPKRSIRNVELPSRRLREEKKEEEIPVHIASRIEDVPKIKSKEMAPEVSHERMHREEEYASYSFDYDKPKKPSHLMWYVFGVIGVLLAAFGISAFFQSATVQITPRHDTKPLNATFTAKKDDTGSNLGFQVVTVSKDVEKTVPATGQKQVDTKAQGKIVIYNNYSTQTQKLVATTRFQTPEGLIFRLVNAVTVPGRQTKSGATVPGSVEALVQADKSGDSYNVDLKDFTIPGFKGDPKYTQIYGRSKTPMSGGFSGMQKNVSSDVLSSADTELESSLKDALVKDIANQIPANFILYTSSLSYALSPITQGVNTTGDTALLHKKGTASAIIFDKAALSRAIVTNLIPESANDTIKVANLDTLTFAYTDPAPSDPTSIDSVSFTLSGNPNFIWIFDTNKLKTDILGFSKQQVKDIVSHYGAIQEVTIETKPFWNQNVPKDPNSVSITNTLEK